MVKYILWWFTLRLLHARRHTGEEIDGRHVHLVLAVRMRHLNGGKVAKDFVGRRKVAHTVFVLNDLWITHGAGADGKEKSTQLYNGAS